MGMTETHLRAWREQIVIDIEHLRAVLAQPNRYFAPAGATHWYQVTSRSEIEALLRSDMRMIAHIDAQLGDKPVDGRDK